MWFSRLRIKLIGSATPLCVTKIVFFFFLIRRKLNEQSQLKLLTYVLTERFEDYRSFVGVWRICGSPMAKCVSVARLALVTTCKHIKAMTRWLFLGKTFGQKHRYRKIVRPNGKYTSMIHHAKFSSRGFFFKWIHFDEIYLSNARKRKVQILLKLYFRQVSSNLIKALPNL